MKTYAAVICLCGAMVLTGACGGGSDSDAPASTDSGAGVGKLNVQNVPPDLQALVPLAEQWGIGDDVERAAKVEAATASQRDELRNAVAPHQARITEWLDSFGQGAMTDEAAAFMYMQLAIEEMG